MIEALTWAFKQQVKPATTKLVLIALSDYANQQWECYPSASAVEEKTCLNRKTIYEAIKSLKDMGYLEDTGKRMGATNQVFVYRILNSPKNGSVSKTPENGQVTDPKTERKTPENGTKDTRKRVTEPSVTVREPSKEPSYGILPLVLPEKRTTPTIEEVLLNAQKIGLPESQANLFFNYYASKGWMVGKTKMKSYTHAMAGWKLRWQERQPQMQHTDPSNYAFERDGNL